jgi:hypothetical protein
VLWRWKSGVNVELNFKEGTKQNRLKSSVFDYLSTGERQVKKWGEDGERKIVSLLSICSFVRKPLAE